MWTRERWGVQGQGDAGVQMEGCRGELREEG